ncbi:hypothetical protein Tco_0774864 [Tanacetum coccineum]|uniref:Synaptobrevin, longin-like domain protein n=1 Tax=Tanacetum coccineum TaxID=301880 RepID=A0ABQ4ZTZ6_9ASTR
MYSPQKFHESCTKLSTETTPPGRSIGQNNCATTPSHLTTNPVTTTALIMSHRCDSPVIDPPLSSPLFWSTAKTKTTNNETQIYAKVIGKSVVVTESSVRSDLQFNDEDGATCLTNVEIFENLALMGYERDSDKLSFEKALFSPHWKYLIHTILHCLSSKSTAWNEFSTNVTSVVICLAKGQKFNFSKLIFDEEAKGSGQPSEPQPTPSPAQSFHEEQLFDIPSSSQPQKTQKHRKGRKLSNRVLDLEKAMTAQAKEIAILKKRVKKLEKRKRLRTQGLKLFKIGTSKRRSLDKEDESKHGRNLNARLISEEDDFDDGFDVVRDEGVTHVEGDVEQVVIDAAEVVNAGVSVSTAEPKTPPTTTTTTLLEDDEVTVAATLVQMSETSKAKSIVFEDVEESAKEQREGKALMVEEDVLPPKKTQK